MEMEDKHMQGKRGTFIGIKAENKLKKKKVIQIYYLSGICSYASML